MNYDTFISILATMSKDDWIINFEGRPYIYKHDMNLSLVLNYTDAPFDEEWATSHADSYATKVQGFFYYGNHPIKELSLVSIDGHRAVLPYPDLTTNSISFVEYNIASIFNDRLDEYLLRSKITMR